MLPTKNLPLNASYYCQWITWKFFVHYIIAQVPACAIEFTQLSKVKKIIIIRGKARN